MKTRLLVLAVLVGVGAHADPAGTPRSRSVLIEASSGGTSVSGTAPISVSGGVVSCIPASAVAGGCLTSGAQEISGSKTFKNGGLSEDIWQCTAQFPRTVGQLSTFASQINYYGVMVGHAPVMPTFDGESLTLMGRRTTLDPAPDLIVTPAEYRDAGGFLAVYDYPGAGQQVFIIAANGDVKFAPSQRYILNNTAEPAWEGSLQDNSGLSGHIALKSSPNLYLAIGSYLQDNHSAIETDGGCPYYDGGTWVAQTGGTGIGADGGVCATYYTYAGNHGDVSIIPHGKHIGGWLLEVKNPETGTATDTKFVIDPKGGMYQPSPMSRANFPARSVGILTSSGQFSYGVGPGTLYYAAGVNEQRWHWYDDKGGYQQVAHQAPLFLPPILLNTAVSVATIGGQVLPSGNAAFIDAIHLYVGTSGTGGTTNINFRVDDGTNQCNFTLACNASTGPKRITGSGLACTSGTPSAGTLTWSITAIGDCGVPLIVTGNITPEIRWR
jgi:hypothetical protein